jgi:type I restriction enzyme S subunit
LKEQKAIVNKVNSLLGYCDDLEQQAQESQEVSGKLMQSTVREVVNA